MHEKKTNHEVVSSAPMKRRLEQFRHPEAHVSHIFSEREAAEDVQWIATMRAKLRDSDRVDTKETVKDPRHFLLSGFDTEEIADASIRLTGSAKQALENIAAEFRDEVPYTTNIAIGTRIAAEYDIRTNNFSTQTRIDMLPDGRKVFIVYNHKGSWMHRTLDTWMKWAAGLKMRKATKKEWKTWFEEKSSIPVIDNNDPNTVVMPFVPNVNAYDALVHNKEIQNFGTCDWAGRLTPADKIDLASRVMDKMRGLHDKGVAWGEAILPNIIFTQDRQPVICDPEVRYHADMPLKEAMARDLKDLCLSIAGALALSEAMKPMAVVQELLDRYGDREVVIELQNLAHKESSLLQRLAKPYELVRSGAGTADRYDAILEAIRDYDTDRLLQRRQQG